MISTIPVWFYHLTNEPSDFASAQSCLPDHIKVKRDTRAKIYAFVLFLHFKLNDLRISTISSKYTGLPRDGCISIQGHELWRCHA